MKIEDIKQGNCRTTKEVAWPGVDGASVFLLLPSCEEQQQAFFKARQHLKRQGIERAEDAFSAQHINAEYDYQLLAICLLEGADHKSKLFVSVDRLRAVLTHDEIGYFVDQLHRLKVDQVEAWKLPIQLDPHLQKIALLLGLPSDSESGAIVYAVQERLL